MNTFVTFADCPVCHQPMRVQEARAEDGALVISEECVTCDHRDTYSIEQGKEENSCLA